MAVLVIFCPRFLRIRLQLGSNLLRSSTRLKLIEIYSVFESKFAILTGLASLGAILFVEERYVIDTGNYSIFE